MKARSVARRILALTLVPAFLLVSAGTMGCEDPPVFPHSPTATIISLQVICFPPLPKSAVPENERKNHTVCDAAVLYSDGGPSVGVTPRATWVSSNTAVATVTCTESQPRIGSSVCGLVRHIATGETEISATYEGATGSRRLMITFYPD